MGLFSGGFLGSGSDESYKNTSTQVTTNTSTNIRDIGITGQNAVDLAAVLTGNVGAAANRTVELAQSTVSDLSDQATRQSQLLLSQAKDIATPVASTLQSFQKNLIWIVAIGAGGLLLVASRKGKLL